MRITIEATEDFMTLPNGTEAPVWVGVTAGGVKVFAVLSTLGCLPEDERVFAQEVEAEGIALTFNGNITVHAAGTSKLN